MRERERERESIEKRHKSAIVSQLLNISAFRQNQPPSRAHPALVLANKSFSEEADMTSSQCSCHRERRPRRRLFLIFLCIILCGPSRANGFAGVRSCPKPIRRRISTRRIREQIRRQSILQMVASNDSTRFLNETDVSASDSRQQQNPRHEGGTTVEKHMQQPQSRIDEMMAETMWEAQTKGPPNPELGPVEFVQAVLDALDHPDDPLPDSGFRTLIRSSSKKWREQTRRSIGAPREASEDAIARGLSHAMGRPGSPFALMVDAASNGDCCVHVAFPSDVLNFEDGTAWIECFFYRFEGMDKTPILATKWSLVQRESDGAWLIDGILFNDLSKELTYCT